MDLEKYYKKFNFPAATTFLKQLKNEEIKVTKKEVDDFIKSRTEQQQTTITSEKKNLGNSCLLPLYKWISLTYLSILETIKDINIYYVLLTYIVERYGRIK